MEYCQASLGMVDQMASQMNNIDQRNKLLSEKTTRSSKQTESISISNDSTVYMSAIEFGNHQVSSKTTDPSIYPIDNKKRNNLSPNEQNFRKLKNTNTKHENHDEISMDQELESPLQELKLQDLNKRPSPIPLLNDILLDKTLFKVSIHTGVPEILQAKHINRLSKPSTESVVNASISAESKIEAIETKTVSDIESKMEIQTSISMNDSISHLGTQAFRPDSPILSPLNAITPPPCIIEPKAPSMQKGANDIGTGSRGTTISATPTLHPAEFVKLEKFIKEGYLPAVPAAQFFDIYDIKSIGPYQLTRTLGAGSTGKVKLAVHEKTGERLAVKIIPREPAQEILQKSPLAPYFTTASSGKKKKLSHETVLAKEARLLREVSLLSLLHHPHIVQLLGYSIAQQYYILFMEYVEGGQLLNYVISHGRLKEKHAREFFRQLLSAVHYCHANSIVHRDLKIENILIDSNGNLKLIDFGLSNFYDPITRLCTFCGSLYYAAPELLCGKPYIGPEIDIWSLGVILYVLTTGKVPFDDKKLPVLHEKIKRGAVEYPTYISPELRHLLSRMIVVHPDQRANMQELLHHVWVNRNYDRSIITHIPNRTPLDMLEPKVIYGVVQTLAYQYSPDLVIRILTKAIGDWQKNHLHPLVSLYYLVSEKISRWRSDHAYLEEPSAFGTRINEAGPLISPPKNMYHGLTQHPSLGLSTFGRRYSSLASSIVSEPSKIMSYFSAPKDHRLLAERFEHVKKKEPEEMQFPLDSIASSKAPVEVNIGTNTAANISRSKLTLPMDQLTSVSTVTGHNSPISQKSKKPEHHHFWMTSLFKGWKKDNEKTQPKQSINVNEASHTRSIHSKKNTTQCEQLQSINELIKRKGPLDSNSIVPVKKVRNILFKGILSVFVIGKDYKHKNESHEDRVSIASNTRDKYSRTSMGDNHTMHSDHGYKRGFSPFGYTGTMSTSSTYSDGHRSKSSRYQAANRLKLDLVKALTYMEIQWNDIDTGVKCIWSNQTGSSLIFDIDIVKISWTGEHALQFRPISGDSSLLKSISKEIVAYCEIASEIQFDQSA